MKNLSALLILLSFCLSSFAADEANKVYVQTTEDVDTSSLKDPRYEIRKGVEKEHNLMDELPSPEDLKVMIKKADLENSVSAMDTLDLDLLCQNLLKRPIELVQKKYPHIDKVKLLTLKRLLQEHKK